MIRVLTVVVFLFSFSNLNGQILILPQTISQGVIQKHQMLNVVINNLSSEAENGRLLVQVTDVRSSELLLEIVSAEMVINPGMKRLSSSDLAQFTSTGSSSSLRADLKSFQTLPVGVYNICFRLLSTDNKKGVLSSECVRVLSEPLVPPHLVAPETNISIIDTRPAFTWSPPAPLSMFSNLSYEILVSKLYDGQSPKEAIQRNIPVFTYTTKSPMANYPATFSELEKGTQYVWKVVAKDNNLYAAESEVWRFKILPDSVQKILSGSPFVKLAREAPEVTVSHEGYIKIEYFNSLSDSLVLVTIKNIDSKNRSRKQQLTFEITVKPGQNLIEYNTGRKIKLDENNVYEVVLSNGKDEKWKMRITPKYY